MIFECGPKKINKIKANFVEKEVSHAEVTKDPSFTFHIHLEKIIKNFTFLLYNRFQACKLYFVNFTLVGFPPSIFGSF